MPNLGMRYESIPSAPCIAFLGAIKEALLAAQTVYWIKATQISNWSHKRAPLLNIIHLSIVKFVTGAYKRGSIPGDA